MKYLFIGGTADGKHIETEGAHYYVVAIPPNPANLHVSSAARLSVEDIAYRHQHYRAHRFMEGVMVYAPDDWSSRQVIEALIRRYPAPL